MTAIRYCVVFGLKDVADRFVPTGEFYLRGLNLEESKILFKKLPAVQGGNFVFRLNERYYDNHTKMDIDYKKSEFSLESNRTGFYEILDALHKLLEKAMEDG